MKQWTMEIAEEKGFTVRLFEVEESDHIRCFVPAPPKTSDIILKNRKHHTHC